MAAHDAVDLRNILQVFFRMKVEESLLSMQMPDCAYFWDIIRRDVYLYLNTELQ
jgi:hypothetical protein